MFDKLFGPTKPGVTDKAGSTTKPEATAFEPIVAPARPRRVNLEKRFTIVAETGQGSMSRVYRASDNETGRTVCLKVQDLAKTAAASSRTSSANRPTEGAVGMRIIDPHVVRTLEHGVTTKGETYIVMEYIDGVSLNFIRQARSLDLAAKIGFLAQAAEGLAAVHAAGFIHHDFGPKNLLVNRDDRVKLIDFGLTVPNTAAFHRPGNRTGTLQYMAPELLRREATDERLDIFSFGVTMFEFLTGKLPYDATTSMAMMLQRINHEPLDIAAADPHLPEDVVALVRKAMTRSVKDRWPSMATMATALRNLPSVAAARPAEEASVGSSPAHDEEDDVDFFETLGVGISQPETTSTDGEPDFLETLGVAAVVAESAGGEVSAAGPHPDLASAASGEPAQFKSTIPREVRHEVWKRDRGRCAECGGEQDLKFKHHVPVAEGGQETVDNILILCKPCRRAKRAQAEHP